MVWDMAQSEKCLPCTHDYWSLDLYNAHKIQAGMRSLIPDLDSLQQGIPWGSLSILPD